MGQTKWSRFFDILQIGGKRERRRNLRCARSTDTFLAVYFATFKRGPFRRVAASKARANIQTWRAQPIDPDPKLGPIRPIGN